MKMAHLRWSVQLRMDARLQLEGDLGSWHRKLPAEAVPAQVRIFIQRLCARLGLPGCKTISQVADGCQICSVQIQLSVLSVQADADVAGGKRSFLQLQLLKLQVCFLGACKQANKPRRYACVHLKQAEASEHHSHSVRTVTNNSKWDTSRAPPSGQNDAKRSLRKSKGPCNPTILYISKTYASE